MDLTNVTGDTLKDAWTIKGLSRPQVKVYCTPHLYGSNATVTALWDNNSEIEYTEEQVVTMQKEMDNGRFTLADKFKDFIVHNVEPKLEQTVTVWKDTFKVYPNKFYNVGEYTKKYPLWNGTEMEMIYHTHTKRVADLDRFKLFFQTLLV